jgi:hypothetical protein
MKGVDSVLGMVESNKKYVEFLLLALIVVGLMPNSILGFEHGIKSLVRPVTDFMNNDIVQFIVFLLLLYSCCYKKDMNMFFLLCVFLLVSRR